MISQVLSEKGSDKKFGMDILSSVQRQDGKRGQWAKGSKLVLHCCEYLPMLTRGRRGEEMQKVILQRIEEREKVLLQENEALRTSLLTLQTDLV